MSPRRPWGILPVKGFERAKTRLSSALEPAEREAVARRLFEHVYGVMCASGSLAGITIATDSQAVEELARDRGADVFRDPIESQHLGVVVDAALTVLADRGIERVVVIMSDLPRLTVADVDEMASMTLEYDFVVAPDSLKEGTNALGLNLGQVAATSLGRPDSFMAHFNQARKHSLRVAVCRNPRLARDLDLPTDLPELDELAGGESDSGAPGVLG